MTYFDTTMKSRNHILWITFKKFNYTNEKCGYTVDGNALIKLNMVYGDYLRNKECPAKNQMTMDWHCGIESDQSIQDDTDTGGTKEITLLNILTENNIVLIKKFIYKKDGRAGSHRCKDCIFIDLFAKKSKCGHIEQDDIIWNQEEHPKIKSSKQRIENCGELFCFADGFEHFVTTLAKKYKINLDEIDDWNNYSSPINPLSSYFNKVIKIKKKKKT
eukprot:233109_1